MELNVKTRDIKGKMVKSLRKKDIIPAVLYGHKIKPQLLQVDFLNFKKVYDTEGESTLIDLKIEDKKPVKVLIHDIKRDYLSNRFSHIDFYQIKEGEMVMVEVALEFTGESKAVKELGGILVKSLDKIKIKCLPKDLIHSIKVDISKLKTFNDSIRVKDLEIAGEIKVLEKEDETVVSVAAPREEEKVETAPEEKPAEGEAVADKKEEVSSPKEGEKKQAK